MRRRSIPYAIFLLVALVYALPGCRSARPREPSAEASSIVYVVRRAWHIDIGFATPELQQPLRALLGEFPSASYLQFGFGDRHYLLTRDRGSNSLIGALWPGPALVLMTGLRATPEEAFGAPNVIRVPITAEQSRSIQTFIWNTLADQERPHEGAPRGIATPSPVADGPYSGSVFYAATPKYSAIHTCNTWAAEGLHAAALPVSSRGVEFSGQVWRQVQRLVRP
jgi:hypothetical protein